MSADFPDDPREFARAFLRPRIKGGKLKFPQRDPNVDAFFDELDLKVRPDKAYDISLEQAVRLVNAALENRRIQPRAREIVFANLMNDGPLPWPLRQFAALCMFDALPKGKQGRGKGDNYERDSFIIFIVESLVAYFDLKATRNQETSEKNSACDIVAEVLAELGFVQLKFDRIVEIYRSKERREERAALNPIKEVARALAGRSETPSSKL